MMEPPIVEKPALSDYEQERGKPMPSLNHSTVELNIGAELRQRYRKTHSIQIELSLKLGDVPVVPDVCVFPKRIIDFENDTIKVTDPPLLAVEILSPTQVSTDVVDKIRLMLAAGVKACWFVQPLLQTVTIFVKDQKPRTLSEGIVADGITGIELPVEEIFSTE